jgi:DNA-binding Lrp family transcriptional regulator
VVRLLAEQGAIPFDQLARFLGVRRPKLVDLIRSLELAGCIEKHQFLVGDSCWFWPSNRGARLIKAPSRSREPTIRLLAHKRAVNEARLYLQRREPKGHWICERDIRRSRNWTDHIPDGIFEVGGERHAIEAELSRKRHHEIRRIVAEHSNRFDAVLYFCAEAPFRLLKEVEAERRWPKLIVRRLPKGGRC